MLHLESVSIVTNGSKVTPEWFERYGAYVDVMAVSCDSFEDDTNYRHGRGPRGSVESPIRMGSRSHGAGTGAPATPTAVPRAVAETGPVPGDTGPVGAGARGVGGSPASPPRRSQLDELRKVADLCKR